MGPRRPSSPGGGSRAAQRRQEVESRRGRRSRLGRSTLSCTRYAMKYILCTFNGNSMVGFVFFWNPVWSCWPRSWSLGRLRGSRRDRDRRPWAVYLFRRFRTQSRPGKRRRSCPSFGRQRRFQNHLRSKRCQKNDKNLRLMEISYFTEVPDDFAAALDWVHEKEKEISLPHLLVET